MKKLSFLTFMVAMSLSALSQKARLNAYGAYVFDDSYDSYYDPYNYYNGKIMGGFQGGVGLEYMLQPRYCLEVMWQHQSTHAPTNYWDGNATLREKYTNFDINLDYVLIGGDGHVEKPGSPIEGYGGLFLGAAFVGANNPDNGNHHSATKFAWGGRLGANVWTKGKLGLKLQVQLLSISQGAGGGLYFGTGGAGVGVSTYSTVYQFSLGGGLTFKLGH
jgi:hypothetical protein